ncbi:MAG: hypothetical protein JKY61_10065, partial [Planctomycetes bacterium]|nr:hypothetical protein [Planctomycetota bacterium]
VRWVESMDGALAIEFGAGDLRMRPLERRRAVVIVGGLDGRSMAGSEAVLHAGYRLLTGLKNLRPDLTFLLVPFASPEGLARVNRGQSAGGRDLDGDGYVLQMLVEDPEGPWTPSLDARFLCRARSGDAPRYQRLTEGAPTGDVGQPFDLERDFPLLSGAGIAQPIRNKKDGEAALTTALRQYILARPCALVVSFQGNHGGLAYPGASSQPPWESLPDLALFENLGGAFRSATGRTRAPVFSISKAREGVEKGSFVDWCYAVPGVLAFEVAPWGVGLREGEYEAVREIGGEDAWDFRPSMHERDRRWATWLDDELGGEGFAEWQPVLLSDGETCQVGGWKPKTYWNPPESALAGALERLDEFVWELVNRLPYLELCDVSVKREQELVTVSARLRCVGALPMQPQTFGLWAGSGEAGSAWLEVLAPQSARRITGPDRQSFPRLDSGGRSATVSWLFHAAEGARLKVEFGLGKTRLGSKELVL